MTDPRFSRIRLLLGAAALERLRRSFVVVAGLGAVGSYAVEALARAGIGRLRLVDFDEIHESNINRQLYALESTLGRPKCEEARRRVLDIHPACQAEALRLFIEPASMDQTLGGAPDVLVDAIDSLSPKASLLRSALERNIQVVSSMGAALRTDPTSVRVGRLSEIRTCPLASRVRERLRPLASSDKLHCIYSLEPCRDLTTKASSRMEADAHYELRKGRKRAALGSLPTLTGIFGLTAANETLRLLLGGEFPLP
ncbi:MAG: tRNA threonylcarbamoyladenosine dehydratase [Elusimicrobiota bacterium]